MNNKVNWNEVINELNTTSRKKQGIGNFVMFDLLHPLNNRDNWLLSNQEVVDIVVEKFPTAKTTTSCISWYKSKIIKMMKDEGTRVRFEESV